MAYKFEWDKGNSTKSIVKHGISNAEAESVFDDASRRVRLDLKHSGTETRYICIGESVFGRILFVYFTERNGNIRIIGTRSANIKERLFYEKGT